MWVLLHCLIRFHRPSYWFGPFDDKRWYCDTCNPRPRESLWAQSPAYKPRMSRGNY